MSRRAPIAVPAHSVLGAFRDRVPPEVVAPTAWDAVEAVLIRLPEIPTWTVIETRASGEPPATDLLVGALRDPSSVKALPSFAPDRTPARAFLESWAKDDRPEASANVLWFEWDSPIRAERPMMLYCLDEAFWPQAGRKQSGLSTVDRWEALRRSAGAPSNPRRTAALRSVLEKLPETGRVLCGTWLGPRGCDMDRLFVSLPCQHVGEWLQSAGWPGRAKAAGDWLHRMVAPWETALLQIEVDEALGPYLAIETPQSGAAKPGQREGAFLDWLVETKHAPQYHRDALLAWRGTDTLDGHREVRSFHVKVVLRPDRKAVVKAYFGIYHCAADAANGSG
jgi:hypothetical protein